ncbi:MAG: sugar kinase [Flavobacteriales bacterium]|nr:sugar kinase [Flavobacteriales bacterium]
MKKTLIVGTVAYDEIETPTESSGKILGGAGTYIGLSASIFEINPSIISIVGGDFEQNHFNLLKSKGIDISSIEIVPKGKTFYWKGKYHKDWNKRDTLNTQLNVLADFNPKLNDEQKQSEIVVLGNLHPAVQSTVLNQIKAENKCVILDTMNFWMDNALDELHSVISRVDIIIINDEEAIQLSGKDTLFAAAQEIMSYGPSHIVIKKGEHGAMLFGETEFFTTPAFPVHIVKDPTGAGDCFAGGFAGFLAQCNEVNFQNLKTAVVHGTINASFCVEGFGTSSIQRLDIEKAQSRFKEFKSFTRY